MSVFLTDWWQEAVGRKVGCRFGIRYILLPQLTPWVNLTEQPEKQGVWYYFEQTEPGTPKPVNLEKQGYTVNERVTYRINDLHDIDAVEKRFSENKRRQIKKSAHLILDTSMTAEAFYDFHADCLNKRGMECSYTREFFLNLAKAVFNHNCGHIICLKDNADNLYAAAFLVMDDRYCYYLIPTYNPTFEKSGAGARLAQESIRFAASKGLSFDFEGSMIPGIAQHYKQFGSTPHTYYSVEKCFNPLFRLLLWVHSIKNRNKGR